MTARPAALVALLVLSGCGKPPLTNAAIIAETSKCKAAGLFAVPLYQPGTSSGAAIVAIQCSPRKAD